MMAEDMMGGAIEPRDIAGITRVLADTDGRFTALIGAARLHPGRDLRGLDLGAIRIGPEKILPVMIFRAAASTARYCAGLICARRASPTPI